MQHKIRLIPSFKRYHNKKEINQLYYMHILNIMKTTSPSTSHQLGQNYLSHCEIGIHPKTEKRQIKKYLPYPTHFGTLTVSDDTNNYLQKITNKQQSHLYGMIYVLEESLLHVPMMFFTQAWRKLQDLK